MNLLVSVVIVNYNGRELLGGCLGGLEAQTRAPDEVIIVDNGSTDDSTRFVRAKFSWVKVVEAGSNLGFASGNNLGFQESTGDLIILLNNDTLPGPGFIEEIVRPLESDSTLGAVAGVLVFNASPEYVASAGIDVHADGLALDHKLGEKWYSLPPRFSVFGPSAGAAAYRRTAFSKAGLLPDDFFMYLEDADLAWRMRLLGIVTIGIRGAWAQHVYSATAQEGSPIKDYYLARNRARSLIRCWPVQLWLRCGWAVTRFEFLALGHALVNRRWCSVRGRFDGWTSLRELMAQRRRIQSRGRASIDELLYWVRPTTSVRESLKMRSEVRALSSGRGPGEE